MLWADLVIDQIALGQRVVVVKCVDSLSLSEAVVHVLLRIEAVHEDEARWLRPIEKLLLEGVAVLAIVDNNLAVASADKPLIVRLKEGNFERVQSCVKAHQIDD